MFILKLLLLAVVGVALLTFLRAFLLYQVTKDLNEKDRKKYYEDVEARDRYTMDQDCFGCHWFNPFR